MADSNDEKVFIPTDGELKALTGAPKDYIAYIAELAKTNHNEIFFNYRYRARSISMANKLIVDGPFAEIAQMLEDATRSYVLNVSGEEVEVDESKD